MDVVNGNGIDDGLERLESSSHQDAPEHNQIREDEPVHGHDIVVEREPAGEHDDQAPEFSPQDERPLKRGDSNEVGDSQETGQLHPPAESAAQIVNEFANEVVDDVEAVVGASEGDEGDAPEKIVSSLTTVDLSLLRSQSNPPALLKTVVESVFLILGFKEKDLKDWAFIKKHLAGTGRSSLKALCMKVEAWNLKEDAVTLVKSNYLTKYSVGNVAGVSSAGAILAKWVYAVVKAAEHYLAHPSEAEAKRQHAADHLAAESKSVPAVPASQPAKTVKIGPLDKRCVSDLKTLAKPPQIVVNVLAAVNVLLGHDIAKKQDWKEIKKGLDANLVQSCLMLDPGSVQLASSKFASTTYLDGMTDASVAKISSAAASFYVWAQSMISDVEAWHNNPESRAQIEERRKKEREAAQVTQAARLPASASKPSSAATTASKAAAPSAARPQAAESKGKVPEKQAAAKSVSASNGLAKPKPQVASSSDKKRLTSKPTVTEAATDKPMWK